MISPWEIDLGGFCRVGEHIIYYIGVDDLLGGLVRRNGCTLEGKRVDEGWNMRSISCAVVLGCLCLGECV